jgi:hypothetical protein
MDAGPVIRPTQVAITVERLSDDPELGVWCDPCALGTGAAFHFLLSINGTPHGIVRRAVCLNCGEVTDG